MGKMDQKNQLIAHPPKGSARTWLNRSGVLASLGLTGMVMMAAAAPPQNLGGGGWLPQGSGSTPAPSGLLAQQSRQLPVKFAPGQSSATIKNSVLRGTRDVYLLEARQQQVMTIKLTSLENNAVFDVMTPPDGAAKRLRLRTGVRECTVRLPRSGAYQIVVGPTRGNASYRLVVSVK